MYMVRKFTCMGYPHSQTADCSDLGMRLHTQRMEVRGACVIERGRYTCHMYVNVYSMVWTCSSLLTGCLQNDGGSSKLSLQSGQRLCL